MAHRFYLRTSRPAPRVTVAAAALVVAVTAACSVPQPREPPFEGPTVVVAGTSSDRPPGIAARLECRPLEPLLSMPTLLVRSEVRLSTGRHGVRVRQAWAVTVQTAIVPTTLSPRCRSSTPWAPAHN